MRRGTHRALAPALALALLEATAACSNSLEPSGGVEPPPPAPQLDGELEPTIVWQPITVDLEAAAAPTAVVGFDRVLQVFTQAQYGPCTLCHEREWPYLSESGGWSRFQASLAAPTAAARGVTNIAQLAALVGGCVDPEDSNRCAGEPGDPNDDLDEKMPLKFGYDLLSGEDLELVRRWVADGAEALSSAGPSNPTITATESATVAASSAGNLWLKSTAATLVRKGSTTLRVVFHARPRGKCTGSEVTLELADAGKKISRILLQLTCAQSVFRSQYRLRLPG
jgi:hypothetical protein